MQEFCQQAGALLNVVLTEGAINDALEALRRTRPGVWGDQASGESQGALSGARHLSSCARLPTALGGLADRPSVLVPKTEHVLVSSC